MDYESIKKFFMSAGVNLLFGILIIVVGLFFTSWFVKILKKSKTISKFDPSLQSFVINTIKLVLIVIIILTAAVSKSTRLSPFPQRNSVKSKGSAR